MKSCVNSVSLFRKKITPFLFNFLNLYLKLHFNTIKNIQMYTQRIENIFSSFSLIFAIFRTCLIIFISLKFLSFYHNFIKLLKYSLLCRKKELGLHPGLSSGWTRTDRQWQEQWLLGRLWLRRIVASVLKLPCG
jgi:hypothetical protein